MPQPPVPSSFTPDQQRAITRAIRHELQSFGKEDDIFPKIFWDSLTSLFSSWSTSPDTRYKYTGSEFAALLAKRAQELGEDDELVWPITRASAGLWTLYQEIDEDPGFRKGLLKDIAFDGVGWKSLSNNGRKGWITEGYLEVRLNYATHRHEVLVFKLQGSIQDAAPRANQGVARPQGDKRGMTNPPIASSRERTKEPTMTSLATPTRSAKLSTLTSSHQPRRTRGDGKHHFVAAKAHTTTRTKESALSSNSKNPSTDAQRRRSTSRIAGASRHKPLPQTPRLPGYHSNRYVTMYSKSDILTLCTDFGALAFRGEESSPDSVYGTAV